MAEIGNSSEELYIRFRNNIYLLNGGSTISILNSDGSLNVKIKNFINNKSPFTNLTEGFYYYNGNLYLRYGDSVIDLQKNNSLPEGSILMYNGTLAPSGWYKYSDSDEFEGVIYITNKSGILPNPIIPLLNKT